MEDRLSESPKSRRRWLRVLAALVLFAFAAPIAWRYRPLSDSERPLVGTWRIHRNDLKDSVLTFTGDRRFQSQTIHRPPLQPPPTASPVYSAGWRVAEGTLILKGDLEIPWSWQTLTIKLRQLVLREGEEHRYSVEFDGPDHLRARLVSPSGSSETEDETLERVP